jgi:hypothetical protein
MLRVEIVIHPVQTYCNVKCIFFSFYLNLNITLF